VGQLQCARRLRQCDVLEHQTRVCPAPGRTLSSSRASCGAGDAQRPLTAESSHATASKRGLILGGRSGNVHRTLHSLRPARRDRAARSRRSWRRALEGFDRPIGLLRHGAADDLGPIRPRVMSSVPQGVAAAKPAVRAATSARTAPRSAPRTRSRRSVHRLPPRRHDPARSRMRRQARPRPRFRPRV
jgi:hypothetical protein